TARVVCVSEDSLRLSAAEGIPGRKLTVIHNGIDTTRFGYLGPTPGGPVVMVGRLFPGKGVDTLLRAVAVVTRRRPDFRLEVAGRRPGRARPGDAGRVARVRPYPGHGPGRAGAGGTTVRRPADGGGVRGALPAARPTDVRRPGRGARLTAGPPVRGDLPCCS